MVLCEPLIFAIIIIVLFYKWSTAKFNILKERKVSHFKPQPFFGNFGTDILLGKCSLAEMLIELQIKFRNNKVYGMYFLRSPLIFVQDAELINKVCVKDFHNFTNHKSFRGSTEPDLGRNLYILKDHEWREMRDILTPIFTDDKIRAVFELIEECCIDGTNYLDVKLNENGTQGLELKMEDIFSRFTNDVILSTVLGIKVVSFRQRENCFFNIGCSVMKMLKASLIETMPTVMKALRVQIFDAKKLRYFNSLVQTTIQYREHHNIVRPDMIHLLMEAKKFKIEGIKLNNADVIAQCLLFFCGGLTKVNSCLCLTTHELMQNPDVQEKLLKEIQEVQDKLNRKLLSYDTLIGMKYMEMVISESLRKWPPCIFTNRICNEDYDLTDDYGNVVVKLKKNDNVAISVFGLHRDPDNFVNPDKFDPERFSQENRIKVRPFTYLPFGAGPRICLAIRFALVVVKAILYHVLLRYKIVSSTNTTANLIDATLGAQHVSKTYCLKLLPRNSSQ